MFKILNQLSLKYKYYQTVFPTSKNTLKRIKMNFKFFFLNTSLNVLEIEKEQFGISN